ncbi:hypothetical protein XH90_14140 [Bradyrhizobium sp. CCBAU 53338]|nr:hypothetical protein XH90_14140 [Bradyrhizobium sp. CCBAU 53338]
MRGWPLLPPVTVRNFPAPHWTRILFALVVFAALIALGAAAVVKDPASFALVAIAWNEIKAVLVLLLRFFEAVRS